MNRFPPPQPYNPIWKLPTHVLWRIVSGEITVDTDDTVELARANLRVRGEFDDLK